MAVTNGYTAEPASAAPDPRARFFGCDIHFDVAAPNARGEANYVVTPAGDLTLVRGREALRQSLIRRLITDPDEWPTLPNFGVGARRFVKRSNTSANRDELVARIRSQFARDPRVDQVSTVVIKRLAGDAPGLMIAISVLPVGRLRQDQALEIATEVR